MSEKIRVTCVTEQTLPSNYYISLRISITLLHHPQAAKPKDKFDEQMRSATVTTAAAAAAIALGVSAPSTAFMGMVTKFGLASICGYQTVGNWVSMIVPSS